MNKTRQELQAENDELRSRLEEAEETLNAIRSGEVDALVVSGAGGQQIYTLTSADKAYRLLLESMREGAVTLNSDGIIIYCNSFFAGLLKTPLDQLTGAHLRDFIPQSEQQKFLSLLAQCDRGETALKAADDSLVPVYLSASTLASEPGQLFTCVIVTDLSGQKRDEKIIADGKLSQIIIQQAAEAIIVCDNNGKIILASIAAHALCGHNPLYKPFDEMFPLALEQGRHFTIQQALAAQVVLNGEMSFLRKGRTTFDLIMTSSRLVDENEKILGCVVMLRDITERKQAAEKLRESEERLRLAQEAARIGAFELNIQTGVNIWSPELEIMYGLAPGEFGKTQTAWENLVHPEDRTAIIALNDQAIKTGNPLEAEWRVVWRDGSVHWIAGRFQCFRDDAGKPLCLTGVNIDITERKRTEEKLRESEERLRLAQETAHLGSFEYIAATLTTVWSEEEFRIYGLDPAGPSPAYDVMLATCIHPDDAELLHTTFTTAMQSGSAYELEHRIVRPDGSVRWVYDWAQPYFNTAGKLVRYVGATLDITERKQLEMEQTRLLNIVHEEKDRLQALVNSISDEIWFADTQKRFTVANLSALKAFGLHRDTVNIDIQKFAESLEVFRPDGTPRPAEESPALRALNGEVVHDEEEIIRIPASGELRHRQINANPVRDAGGRIIGSVSVVHDITERKQAEVALRVSEQRFSFAMEALNAGLWDWDKTTNKVYYCSRWKSMLGYTENEIGDGLEEFTSRLHPEDREHTLASVEKHLKDKTSQYSLEFRLRHKAGHYINIHSRAVRIRDASGASIRMIGLHTDITERKAIENAQLFLLQCGQKEGDDFFESLARYLAEHLEMDAVCIDKLTGDRLSAQTLAMYCDGHFEDAIEYTLQDTPCGDVVGKTICTFPRDVCRLFPKDAALQALQAESYVGTTLWGLRGEPIGLIAVIGRKPLADTALVETILTLVSMRASGELERRDAEQKIVKANKAYEALSVSGQALLHARNEAEFLHTSVRIVHEICGYSLVWLGFAEHDAAKTVRVVAHAGDADGYLDTVRVTWANNELGRGPTGTAIRTHKPVINHNTRTTASLAPWRDRQLQHGYVSSASFPLLVGEKVLGALTVYASTAGAFSDEEARLLMELSSSLAYGIVFLRMDAERKKVEELLRTTAQFPEENPSPVLRVSHDGILLYANQSSEDLLDFWQCRIGAPVPKKIAVALQEALHTGENRELEVSIRDRVTLSFVVTPIAEHRHCNLYGRDITAIRAAEASLHIVNARLDILAETGSKLLKSKEPQLIVDFLCRRLMSFLDCQMFFNFLVDTERQQLHLNAFGGISQEEAAKIEWLDFGVAVCGCVARDGCRIVAEDIVNTPDSRTELVKSYGMQAYACHPLMAQGQVIGTLSFGTCTRPRFTDDDLALMKAVADQVAIAMERKYAQDYIARLNSDLQSNVQELEDEVKRRTLAEKILIQYTEDLSRSNEELDSFAAAVSHDLQEPLRSIAGFMRLLEKKYGNLLDSRGTEYIERSVASAKRLGGMLNSLLAYSRITTRGKGFEHHELDDVLKTAIENLTASIGQTRALITCEPLPRIYGDRDQLVRVFQNLIVNSIKYCERSRPEIDVSWQRSADTCIIAVTDNGPGIEPEYLERIFEIFTRCSSNQTVAGAGMGLALCKKIIERHRGKIWVESVPGKGTTFFFSLPLQ